MPDVATLGSWPLLPSGASERRRALVLVVSDYSGGAQSLPGAKQDAERIGAALIRAGFKTEIALDLDLPGMRRKLGDFAALTRDDDAAVVYTTGHGVEVGGSVFLIPGAYPVRDGIRGGNANSKLIYLPTSASTSSPAAAD